MKNVRNAVFALGLVGATFAATRAVYSQDGEKKDAAADAAAAEAAEMQKMVEAAVPGEEHKKLAALAGTWDSEFACKDPMGNDMVCKGVATYESALGGRVLVGKFTSDMGGMPFEAVSLVGYDNIKKQHWTEWCDSMGTGTMHFTGNPDKDGNVTQSGEYEYLPGKKMTMTIVTKHPDADHMVLEMKMSMGGGPEQPMTIKYTRRK